MKSCNYSCIIMIKWSPGQFFLFTVFIFTWYYFKWIQSISDDGSRQNKRKLGQNELKTWFESFSTRPVSLESMIILEIKIITLHSFQVVSGIFCKEKLVAGKNIYKMGKKWEKIMKPRYYLNNSLSNIWKPKNRTLWKFH